MEQEEILYMAIAGMIVLLLLFVIGSYGPFKLVVLILALLAFGMIVSLEYVDFLLFPLVTIITKTSIMPAKGYSIPKNQKYVVKNVNGIYYATGFITANIYKYVFAAERVGEDEESQLSQAPENWERIVMNTHFPFKFNLITFAQDIQEYREELEGQRGFLEQQLSKEMSGPNPSQMAIDDFQRKINVLQARIDRISSGERPLWSIMYIETTAAGVSEKAAADSLENQINQLQTIFNSMDISMMRIVGRELYYLFKFNFALPTLQSDIMKLFHKQK
ncbi:MAG: hypothetical protein ACP5K9_01380 [Candidatus Micrarchaeia archaeon]